jgi:hypothetical protein
MAVVSQAFALLVFLLILCISALIAWAMKTYAIYDRSTFRVFISILTGLGVFITFLFYYNVVSLQNDQQKLAFIQELDRIDDSLIDSIMTASNTAANIIPNFVLSINPLCAGECQAVQPGSDPSTTEAYIQKQTLSFRVFTSWKDILVSNVLLKFNALAYITNFLQRANSSQLYAQWVVAKIDFSHNVQTFGDLLFEYGLPIKEQTPESYVTAAHQFIDDPRYNQLQMRL